MKNVGVLAALIAAGLLGLVFSAQAASDIDGQKDVQQVSEDTLLLAQDDGEEPADDAGDDTGDDAADDAGDDAADDAGDDAGDAADDEAPAE